MNFKFFKGVIKGQFTIDPFQTVPENHRIELVDPIYYNSLTSIPTRRVYCRHIVTEDLLYTEELVSFLITDTHWLWDYNE